MSTMHVALWAVLAAQEAPAKPPPAAPTLATELAVLLAQVDYRGYDPQEARPFDPDSTRRAGASRADTWLYFALAPLRGARNSAWHGLFGTPPLEDALALPNGAYHVRLGVDFSTTDWTSEEEGGSSRFQTVHLTESFEYTYAVSGYFLLGLRLTAGELGAENEDEPITVFEDGIQLVPAGERAFGSESLTGRAKFAMSLGGAVEAGLLGELKVPLAEGEEFLTSRTVDLSVSGLLTKRWSRFALHLNVGATFPFGTPDLLIENDDASPYLHGGAAASWLMFKPFSLVAQVEFNTSPFADVTLWNEPSATASIGARLKLSKTAVLSGSVGTGLTDASSDLVVSGGVDMTF